MTYTAVDFTDDTIAALTSKGYTVCECDDGFWFTWARPDGRGDVEVGETHSSVHSAWFDALSHWLNNTDIEFDEQAWAPPGRRAEDQARPYNNEPKPIDTQATPAEIQQARNEYTLRSNDQVKVDDNAKASRGEDGTWVQAWVWLAHDEDEDISNPTPKGT